MNLGKSVEKEVTSVLREVPYIADWHWKLTRSIPTDAGYVYEEVNEYRK